jgi:FemAB-related protein (PEP-CTERM system-associated)
VNAPETKPLSVRALKAGDEVAWDRFVTAQPHGTFFHLAGWKRVIEESFGHSCPYLLAEHGGQITGVLPLTHLRSRFFVQSLVSNAFCVYGGPISADEESLQALDEAACTLAEDLGVANMEYRLRQRLHETWHCNDQTYCTFRKELQPDPDANLAKVRRKQRAMVRKAIKSGLVSHVDHDPKTLYRLYAESLRNLGTPVFGRRYLDILHETFRDKAQILTVTLDERPLASVLSFFFRDEVLPYYGGGSKAAKGLAANDFMYWEVLRRAVEAGYRCFDFGRSKTGTGAYNFKRHWGFEPEPLFYEHRLFGSGVIPERNPLNPKYGTAISIWKQLPLPVANTLGPILARGLG